MAALVSADDVRGYSIAQVRNWVAGVIDAKYADILAAQETDGPALLLLTKEDLKGVGILLGPATTLHQAIQNLAGGALRPLLSP